MSRRAKQWTVVYVERIQGDDDPDPTDRLTHAVVRDRSALDAKLIALCAQKQAWLVISGEPLEVVVDTSPRITLGSLKPKTRTATKPKKKQSEPAS